MTQYQTAALAADESATARRERLIVEHLPQVRWIALRLRDSLPPNISLDDLISAGVLGLIAAVDHFDPTRGVKLNTYAEHKIRGAILDSLRGLDGIPVHKRKKASLIEEAITRAQQKVQRAPSEDEIAAELEISVEEYQEWLVESQGVSLGSLDSVPDSGSEGLLRYIGDGSESQERTLERGELRRLLVEALQEMPQLERTILSLYYVEGLNLREIAPIVKYHLSRVSQLKIQGILRLRSYVQKRWPTERGLY
jgi:RNA polymerase sigma factor for flagellar operon FliA